MRDKYSESTTPANQIKAYLGRTNFSDTSETYLTRYGSKIDLHPNWDTLSDNFNADMAIITMNNPVTFSDFISPICMPVDGTNIFGIRGSVAGFGLTEHSITRSPSNALKHISIPTVTQEECLFDNPEYAAKASKKTFCGGERGKIPW